MNCEWQYVLFDTDRLRDKNRSLLESTVQYLEQPTFAENVILAGLRAELSQLNPLKHGLCSIALALDRCHLTRQFITAVPVQMIAETLAYQTILGIRGLDNIIPKTKWEESVTDFNIAMRNRLDEFHQLLLPKGPRQPASIIAQPPVSLKKKRLRTASNDRERYVTT